MPFFKSAEDRRIERDMKIRHGVRRIEKSIKEQGKFTDEFLVNARRAKSIGDTRQYEFIRASIKKTLVIKKVLERQLLSVKNALLIKRQAEAGVDFTNAMSIMATEIGRMFETTNMGATQMEWEKAMAKSQNMGEQMDDFLDNVEGMANDDASISTTSTEIVTDAEIDGLIVAEENAAAAGADDGLDDLQAELDALKGDGERSK